MQHVGEPDAVCRLELDGDGREQIGLAEQRLVARKPARRPRQTMSIDVEKDQLLEPFRIGPVIKNPVPTPASKWRDERLLR